MINQFILISIQWSGNIFPRAKGNPCNVLNTFVIGIPFACRYYLKYVGQIVFCKHWWKSSVKTENNWLCICIKLKCECDSYICNISSEQRTCHTCEYKHFKNHNKIPPYSLFYIFKDSYLFYSILFSIVTFLWSEILSFDRFSMLLSLK